MLLLLSRTAMGEGEREREGEEAQPGTGIQGNVQVGPRREIIVDQWIAAAEEIGRRRHRRNQVLLKMSLAYYLMAHRAPNRKSLMP